MKEIIIGAVLLLIFLLFVGHFSISIKPFNVELPYWHRSLGLFLIILAFIVYNIGEHTKGYIDGIKKGSDMTWELIEKKMDQQKNSH